MPTYEYQCKDCGFKFEQFHSIADSPLEECPSCNGKLERLVSGGAGLIFKGSGFYITDYKQRNTKENSDSKPKKKEPEVKTPIKKDEKSSQ